MSQITEENLRDGKTVVHFPNQSGLDPLSELKNEFLCEDEAVRHSMSGCEYLENRTSDLGQLELFVRIQDQIKAMSDRQSYIQHLLDEIDMYLPRKTS